MIAALLDVLGPRGTLVMPAESPQLADPTSEAVFDPLTTPTTMGAIPEAFRSYPGTLRSNHPLVSVCANGHLAQEITAQHALEFCEGPGTPFEKLYELDAWTLLLGVGFNRCTSLHYAESLVAEPQDDDQPLPDCRERRAGVGGEALHGHRRRHALPHRRQALRRSAATCAAARSASADALLFSTRALVDFAESLLPRASAHMPRKRCWKLLLTGRTSGRPRTVSCNFPSSPFSTA